MTPLLATSYNSASLTFFVDEFQDTDPLKAEILLLLAADNPDEADWQVARPIPGKLFVVGDPKQSIYRFRRADIALYEKVKIADRSEEVSRDRFARLHVTAQG